MLLGLTLTLAVPARAAPITLTSSDGVVVSGDYQSAGDPKRPIILLFHMASSNRGEYEPIARRLAGLGFDTLAIDQRSGGRLWGRANETVARLGRSAGFTSALPDLEAALAFARRDGRTGKVIVMGSSYSASLVFILAARHPNEIAALIAYSPGEYFGGSPSVREAAAKVTAPVFVSSASDPSEIRDAQAIVAAVRGPNFQHAPKNGTHGAGTLRDDVNPAGAADNWAKLEAFLKSLK
jgi:dienelactone hydrolase